MHNNLIVRRFLSLYLESRATPGNLASHSIKLKTWLQFTLSIHVMNANVLTLLSSDHLILHFPRTVHLCSSVCFHVGCNSVLSLLLVVVLLSMCFPLQPNKCLPSVANGRMVMGLQDLWISKVTAVITFLHHNIHQPVSTIFAGNISVQGDVIILYAIWLGPEYSLKMRQKDMPEPENW
jgi:hypothetical protein